MLGQGSVCGDGATAGYTCCARARALCWGPHVSPPSLLFTCVHAVSSRLGPLLETPALHPPCNLPVQPHTEWALLQHAHAVSEPLPSFGAPTNLLYSWCMVAAGHASLLAINGSVVPSNGAGGKSPADPTPDQQQQQQQQKGGRSGGLVLNGKRFLLVNTTLMLFKLLDE